MNFGMYYKSFSNSQFEWELGELMQYDKVSPPHVIRSFLGFAKDFVSKYKRHKQKDSKWILVHMLVT